MCLPQPLVCSGVLWSPVNTKTTAPESRLSGHHLTVSYAPALHDTHRPWHWQWAPHCQCMTSYLSLNWGYCLKKDARHKLRNQIVVSMFYWQEYKITKLTISAKGEVQYRNTTMIDNINFNPILNLETSATSSYALETPEATWH